MTEEQFLKTMIETVKYDDEYAKKDELLAILRNSIITFDRTGTYGNKRDHFQEYIDLRVPIPMLNIAKKQKGVFQKIAYEVYIEPKDADYEFSGLNIKPKPIELDKDTNIEHDVVFDEIKEIIIQGIRNAQYTIWVAVAWFTDRDIFDELLLRKREGVNVRIITSDEHTNRFLLPDLEKNFEVVKVQIRGDRLSNRFHDKFCIIDLEYVMHGSYNWSNNAKNNDETWATALDRDFVRKFADEFIKLFVKN